MAPPDEQGQMEKKGVEWDNKSLKVVTRMLWLYAVAMEGRNVSARGADRGRPVAFMMEHPPMEKDGEDLGSRSRRRSVWENGYVEGVPGGVRHDGSDV